MANITVQINNTSIALGYCKPDGTLDSKNFGVTETVEVKDGCLVCAMVDEFSEASLTVDSGDADIEALTGSIGYVWSVMPKSDNITISAVL